MNFHMPTKLKAIKFDRNAVQITAIYLLIGGLWILFSDRFAEAISSNVQTLITISTYKGWFYVLVTGLLLYWLIHRNNLLLQREHEELQISEKNYRDIFDHATVGIYRSTPDGRLLTVNPELASTFGYDSPEEFLASIKDVANQIYQEPARRQDFLMKLNEQGFIKEFVNQERRRDGSVIWTSTTARVVKDDAGNVLYYEGFNIDITERKRSEESIKKILDTAMDGFYLTDMEGRILEANDSYCSMIGYRREELLKMSIKDIEAVETEEIIKKRIQRIFETGSDHFETKHKRKNGSVIAIEASVNYLKDEQGGQGKLFVFMRDITERKQIEEKLLASEMRYRRLFEAAKDGIILLDGDTGEIVDVNPFLKEILGYSQTEFLGKQLWEIGLFKDIAANKAAFLKLQQEGYVRYENLPLQTKEGQPIWVEFVSNVYNVGKRHVIQCNIRNITERKLVQNKLQESEEKFRKAFQTSPDSININRLEDGMYVSINKGFTQIMGYCENDVLGKTSLDLQIWESPEDRKKLVDGLKESGQVNNLEARFKAKNGDILYGLMSAAMLDLNGVPHIISITRDITKRRQAEEALEEERNLLHTLMDNLPDSIYFKDSESRFIRINQAQARRFGVSDPAQVLGKTDFDFFAEEHSRPAYEDEQAIMKSGQSLVSKEEKETWLDGRVAWVSSTKMPLRDQKGKIIGTFGISRDITERKQAEKRLIESEERYRGIFEGVQDAIFVEDRDYKILDVNQRACEIFGYSREQFKTMVVEDLIPSKEYFVRFDENELEGTGTGPIETVNVRANSERFPVEISARLSKLGDRRVILLILRDITERKQAEESIRKASLYNRSLIEASLDPLVTIGPDGKIMDVNASTENATGFKREQLLGTDFSNYFTEPEKARSGYQEVFQKGAVRNYPLELKRRDGSLTPVSYNATVYYDTEGDLIGVFAAARDITERKNAEEALRMRLAQLELIYQSGLELSQILEPEQIAQKMIDQLEKQLNWHHTAIRLYDAESETLKIIGFNAPNMSDALERQGLEGHFNSLVQKPGDGLSGWVIQHDQALRIGDLKLDSRYIETFPGLNSGLYVPIKTESRITGVISVENELPNAFSESDERLVQTLASQAAIAFENSRLHKETERQLHQLQALHFIDLAITNSLDLSITIEVLINQAIQQLGLDAAAIFVLQSDVNSLKYLSSKGFRAHLLETASQDLLLNESFAGRAIYGRRAIESPASQEPKEELREIWMTEGFHTVYAIPLLTKGESKGVIEVFYRSENKRPTKIQKDFLETLASQAAIAIENIHLFEGLHRSNMELAIAYDATIEGWSRAMDLRDEETEGHTKRVVEMALELAADFGFSGDMLTQIRRGALLHDIGKLGVPDFILHKPGALTDEEWVIMKKHPVFAFEMLSSIQYLNRALNIPYCHHEKWDGSGYPRGLSGEQIPLEARIFAVVDVWDALTSDRPYRKAWTKPKTIKYIESLAGTHFDPAVVDRFLELQKREEQQRR